MTRLSALFASALITMPMALPAQQIDVGSEEFGAAVREYLLANPEVIFEAVEVHNQRQEVAAREAAQEALVANAAQITNEDFAIIEGNPDGDVVVVEFSDYNCGYCKRSHSEIAKLVENDPNVKVIIQHFPIFGGEPSVQAAMVIMATHLVSGPEDAKALHAAVFENDGRWDQAATLNMAEGLGLDRGAIETTLAEQRAVLTAAISERVNIGQQLGFNGTPGFVIGNELLPGYAPADVMGQIVANARQNNNS